MKASDYIVAYFESRGIHHIFGYIGGMITHLVDSIYKNPNVSFIQTYHEQTAAIAAEGYAIESGLFGVAIATSGPGATNMITGIADAYFGNIPVVYITGQVNTYEFKYNKPIRQQGFQETDVVNIVKPITKYAVLIDDANNLKNELEKAIYIATSGRKGPVLIDLPMDISRAEINPDTMQGYIKDECEEVAFDESYVQKLISDSKCPMVLIGGGCYNCGDILNGFVKNNNIPVVTSLMGRGIIDETYENYIGMIGSYGNRCANIAIQKADLLIALGTRLDTRQTGAMYEEFLKNGIIIHVDIDENELKYHRLQNRVQVCSSVKTFVEKISNKCYFNEHDKWNLFCKRMSQLYSQDREIERFVDNKMPYCLFQTLNEITKEGDVITADVGQNEMWAAQTIRLKKNQKFICSGGLAPMGFSLPAAIGSAFANPKKNVYCITGDGGFHISIQSLLLVSQYNLNIKIIILNNKSLGMITQFQHLYFNDRMSGTTNESGYLVPDFKYAAKMYRIPYYMISNKNLNTSTFEVDGYCLFDYYINGLTSVYPKLEYNKPINIQIPLLEKSEIEEIENASL